MISEYRLSIFPSYRGIEDMLTIFVSIGALISSNVIFLSAPFDLMLTCYWYL